MHVWLTLITIAALAQTASKVEIIRGGTKKKKPPITAPADTDAQAAKERELAAKAKELDEKTAALEAKDKALDAKKKDLDDREETLKADKEEEQKRKDEQKKAAERYSRDTNSAMGQIGDALGGN